MYEIGVEAGFDAAHRLEGHPGKCSALHGHSWKVEAVLASEEIGEDGMLVDFDHIRGLLGEAIGPLDHSYLNELEAFKGLPPTAENVAGLIYRRLSQELESAQEAPLLKRVTVWESSETWASCTSG